MRGQFCALKLANELAGSRVPDPDASHRETNIRRVFRRVSTEVKQPGLMWKYALDHQSRHNEIGQYRDSMNTLPPGHCMFGRQPSKSGHFLGRMSHTVMRDLDQRGNAIPMLSSSLFSMSSSKYARATTSPSCDSYFQDHLQTLMEALMLLPRYSSYSTLEGSKQAWNGQLAVTQAMT